MPPCSITGSYHFNQGSKVLTNNMGEYNIAPDKGDKLQITYVGYPPESVNIGDNDM